MLYNFRNKLHDSHILADNYQAGNNGVFIYQAGI